MKDLDYLREQEADLRRDFHSACHAAREAREWQIKACKEWFDAASKVFTTEFAETYPLFPPEKKKSKRRSR